MDPKDLAVVALRFDTDGCLPIEEHALCGSMGECVKS
jgi:hypothetical protein